MDMFVDILKQLGADQSLLYQFIIIIVLFYLTKFLFLDHLQQVLDNREEKTIKLDGSADKKFEEIDKIKKEYKARMQSSHKELNLKSEKRKNELMKSEDKKYKKNEDDINQYIEKSRKEIEEELNIKREDVLSDAQELSNSLVQSMTRKI